jgi:hypothetical protein
VGFVSSAGGNQQQLAKGHELWRQRLSKSALEAFQAATRDKATAAEAWEAIGRIYLFKGWQEEGAFPGWHDEPEYREQAVAALEKSLAADPSRASAAEALKQAEAFAASTTAIPPAAPPAEVKALDAKIESFRADKQLPAEEFDKVIAERTRLQADPAPYFTGAQIMFERGDYARASDLATRGAAAGARFISENESAYKMTGKSSGARARTRALALDMLGSIALAKSDLDTAAKHLDEAERLTRGQDFLVQFHLGELAQARGDSDKARDHYLNALSLTGGPPQARERATKAVGDVRLSEEIERRRAERREAAVKSIVDRQLPSLAITTVDGTKAIDVKALRGKVLLLNFFSSW